MRSSQAMSESYLDAEAKGELLRSWMDTWVAGESFPGMMAGIYDREGKELFYHACDNSSRNPAIRPYTRDTLFRMYSMTKPITAVAAMILWDRNLLSPDDELAKFIPAFANCRVLVKSPENSATNVITEPLQQPILIRHLLMHTSGFT